MTWRHYLRIKTREPAFLWRMVIAILLVGAAVAALVQYLPYGSVSTDSERIVRAMAQGRCERLSALVDATLRDGQANLDQLLELLPALHMASEWPTDVAGPPLGDIRKRIAAAPFAPRQRAVALALWDSLGNSAPAEPLLALAAREPQLRYAHYALGVYWRQAGAPYRAAAAYEREGRLPRASAARRQAINVYLQQDDADALERLWRTPGYAEDFPAGAVATLAATRRKWAELWWAIPSMESERFAPGAAAMAGLTALFWLLFCLHAAQVDSPRGGRSWVCLAGVVLGTLSIWPTDFLILWQEHVWQLVKTDNLAGGLRYFILGVGLREELAKLVCLLPLVPALVHRRRPLEALIAGAGVGLGFAAAENSRYFAASHATDSVGRFLTANFFHMAATGLAGLALCRAIWHPRTCGPELAAVVGVLVCAHGLYDALIALPQLAEYSLGSMIIYVLLSYQFFHELRAARPNRPETISLTATFLLGVTCVTAASFVYLSADMGWAEALRQLAPEVLGLSLMVYMFLREMPESLVTV